MPPKTQQKKKKTSTKKAQKGGLFWDDPVPQKQKVYTLWVQLDDNSWVSGFESLDSEAAMKVFNDLHRSITQYMSLGRPVVKLMLKSSDLGAISWNKDPTSTSSSSAIVKQEAYNIAKQPAAVVYQKPPVAPVYGYAAPPAYPYGAFRGRY